MMSDIFSTFDPAMSYIFSSSPLIFYSLVTFSLILTHSPLWMTPTHISWLLYFPINFMLSQTSRTFSLHLKGFPSILVALFLMLILLNLMGLLPYNFSFTSHLILTLTFGFPLWLSLILSALLFSPKSFLAHLLPSGAPIWLNPFLIITETLSISVRFLTLSFRLAANMSAGHILLSLMGIATTSLLFLSFTSSTFLILIQLSYITFEIGICLIQAYIFCLLLSLYADDHPHM
uniref:F-ATPase protein 6 n=1 Tax=Pelagomacellicephala iliffei TaxID=1960706 RepID=A0A8E7IW67_9ANNE|nr:ATP synthase F0 subunit 6 [Pelagomacellicephala iliffei]